METKDLRVLIVDDDLFMMNLLTQQFKNEGISQVSSATSEIECLELIDHCDIIILDYYLNEENGIDILRKIKSLKPNIPVIFLSGQEYVNVAIRSLKYGAFDYIEKSKMNFVRIMDIIHSAMEHQKTINKNIRFSGLKSILFSFL